MRTDLNVSIALDHDGAAWDAFVESRGDTAGHHSWRWRRVFRQALGHEPLYLIARRGDDIAGVLPLAQLNSLIFGRTLTSLPFLNYGGVMTDIPEVAGALVEAAYELARRRRCSHVEFRHVARKFKNLPCKPQGVSLRIPLGGRFDPSIEERVREAQDAGLIAQRGGVELIGDFYGLFERNQRELGVPACSRRFFELVLREFPAQARVIVVRLGSRLFSAGVTFSTKCMGQLLWRSSAREEDSSAADLLLRWDAIRYASEHGARVFDLGRSTPSGPGLQFGDQWHAIATRLHWEYQVITDAESPHVSEAKPRAQFAKILWQLLPRSLNRRIVPPMARPTA